MRPFITSRMPWGFADADACLDRVPFGDLADRLRRGLTAVAGQQDVGGLGVREGVADRVVALGLQ